MSEEERRLPSVFMVSGGRMLVDEARLRLGGGTAKDITQQQVGGVKSEKGIWYMNVV